MTQMRRLVVETVVSDNFRWVARDQVGSVHVFEEKPNLDYGTNADPTTCDMWDVYKGETMQVSPKTAVSANRLTEELGDWRDSCKEITELTCEDIYESQA